MMSSPAAAAAPPSLIAEPDLDWLCALAAASPPGDFIEVGVYQGGSAERLYAIAEQQGRTLYLYDTFTGHPSADPAHDRLEHHSPGRYANAIAPQALAERLPNAVIVPGAFPATLRATLRPIAFVHSDVDLYEPTRATCELFPPRMIAGGMLYFDDYSWGECPGVREAVDAAFGAAPALPNGKRLVIWGGDRR